MVPKGKKATAVRWNLRVTVSIPAVDSSQIAVVGIRHLERGAYLFVVASRPDT
ncbi:MAG: hypothetical protein IT425_09970 [Pirellulales bacterium]|nr:hypothetical protein [Pirellulales bacterium]